MKNTKNYKHGEVPLWLAKRCREFLGVKKNSIGAGDAVCSALKAFCADGDASRMLDHYGTLVVENKGWLLMQPYLYPSSYELFKIERGLNVTIIIHPIKSWYNPEKCCVITMNDGAPKCSMHWPVNNQFSVVSDYYNLLGK